MQSKTKQNLKALKNNQCSQDLRGQDPGEKENTGGESCLRSCVFPSGCLPSQGLGHRSITKAASRVCGSLSWRNKNRV